MTKLILAILLLIGCFFCGSWLAQNAGFVKIVWCGYVVETSVSFCIALVLCILLFIYLLTFPFRWLDGIRSLLSNKKDEKAQILLGQILTNIFCNETQENGKLIKALEKTKKVSEGVILILKAQTTQTMKVFEELTQNSITEQIGWRGIIDTYMARGEIIKACEQIEELLDKDSKQPWLLKQALALFVQNGQWKRADDCLEKLFKQKQLSKEDYARKKATLLIKMNKGEQAFDICPQMPQAALLAATQKPKKAIDFYLKSWAQTPSWDVYKSYIKLFAKENTLAQFKHVEKLCEMNKNAKLNALVLADAAINAKLWSEAKRLLNGYMAMYPLSMRVAGQMAFIESEANHDLKEAQNWIEKAVSAYPDSQYVCAKCGHGTDTWAACCPVCNEFSGLKAK